MLLKAGKTPRVLLLDDDRVMLEFVAEMLHALGIDEVLTAEDGEQGLALLDAQDEKSNILICDLQMPGMDGIEFLRHLAARAYEGDVVLLSGVAVGVLKAAERLAKEHGLSFLGILEKPVAEATLSSVLAKSSHGFLVKRGAGPIELLSPEEVRVGIASGCVDLHYQPKVSLNTRSVLGAECLARWRHPERGLLAPNTFIPVVEQHGFIDDFTLAVFRKAVAQQRSWLDEGREIQINVNISMDNLLRLDLPEVLEQIVRQAGCEPGKIVLEVTESRLMFNLKLSLDILVRLRLKGFGLSIDDFGTGYSTMETLQQLPFSELKIDRAFVHGVAEDAAQRAILESSVRLGRTFSLNIVAEGVETQDDWDAVLQSDCDEAQGYFIAKPMPATELIGWIDRWNRLSK